MRIVNLLLNINKYHRFNIEHIDCLIDSFKKVEVEAVPESGPFKLRRMLRSTKDSIPKNQRSGVYRIRCQDGCPATYIGQTKRKIVQRFKEYLGHFRRNEPERSKVAEHLLTEVHFTNVDKLELVKEVQKPEHLDFYEALAIRRETLGSGWSINGDSGPVDTVIMRAFEKQLKVK